MVMMTCEEGFFMQIETLYANRNVSIYFLKIELDIKLQEHGLSGVRHWLWDSKVASLSPQGV